MRTFCQIFILLIILCCSDFICKAEAQEQSFKRDGFYCAKQKNKAKWQPGILTRKGIFKSYRKLIRSRRNRGKKIRRFKKKLRKGLKACELGMPGDANSTWISALADSIKASIIWSADHEEGMLSDWNYPGYKYPGGGIFNTGGEDVRAYTSSEFVHSGTFAACTEITNAWRAKNGNRAVRLMRWTDKPWDLDGHELPQEAYYSTWIYFAENYNPNKYEPWDPGDGGWWNVFQFKSDDSDGVSQPVWVLDVAFDEAAQKMLFYLYSKYNMPKSYEQKNLFINPQQWIHLEVFYKQDADGAGSVKVWQDSTLLFEVDNVTTKLAGGATFGLGNYTDHIDGGATPGTARVCFDDVVISTTSVR